MQEQLFFYNVDMKYIRDLSKVDDNVLSVSPQIEKQNRPFVGILVMINGKQYCAPISSPNITPIELKILPNDSFQTQHYKRLVSNQLKWCRSHSDAILKNAQKTYNIIVNGTGNQSLKKSCCNFKKLENVLEKRLSLKQENMSDIDKLNLYKIVLYKSEAILSRNPELNKMYQAAKQEFLNKIPAEKHAKPIDDTAPISEQIKAAKALKDECYAIIISNPELKAAYLKAKECFEMQNSHNHKKKYKNSKNKPGGTDSQGSPSGNGKR